MPQNPQSGVPMKLVFDAIRTWNLGVVKRLCGNDYDFLQPNEAGTPMLHQVLLAMIIRPTNDSRDDMLQVLKFMIASGADPLHKPASASNYIDDDRSLQCDYSGKDCISIVEEFLAQLVANHSANWYQFVCSNLNNCFGLPFAMSWFFSFCICSCLNHLLNYFSIQSRDLC